MSLRDDYIFCNKIEMIVSHSKMIFPVVDLVPDICAGLSVSDIRALACVSHGVNEVIAIFTAARIEETVEQLRIYCAIHYKTVWPLLGRVIKHDIGISSESFHIDVSRLAPDYTGMLTIIGNDPPYTHYNTSYISVRNGMARFGVSTYIRMIDDFIIFDYYVYAVYEPVSFVRFIDMITMHMLGSEIGNGYIDDVVRDIIHARAHELGYTCMRNFIGSTEFMKIFA